MSIFPALLPDVRQAPPVQKWNRIKTEPEDLRPEQLQKIKPLLTSLFFLLLRLAGQ